MPASSASASIAPSQSRPGLPSRLAIIATPAGGIPFGPVELGQIDKRPPLEARLDERLLLDLPIEGDVHPVTVGVEQLGGHRQQLVAR